MNTYVPGRQTERAWQSLQPPFWSPFVWWAALVATAVSSLIGDPGLACTVQSPCRPDYVLPVVAALLGIAVFAFWWLPRTALIAGLVGAVLGTLFDPSRSGRWAAAGLAVVAAGGLVLLSSRRQGQARIAQEASRDQEPPAWHVLAAEPATDAWGAETRVRPAASRSRLPVHLWAVGVGGAVLMLLCLIGYLYQANSEQLHRDRAVVAPARVSTHLDEDYRQVFRIETGPEAGALRTIAVAEELDVGSMEQVLIDPKDPTWNRLVGEPEGFTHWVGWATFGGFGLGWTTARVVRSRARRVDTLPAVHRVRRADDPRAIELILATSTHPVARLRVSETDLLPRHGMRGVPAVVHGPVADGGWVSITTEVGVLPVAGAVQPLRRWSSLGDEGTAGVGRRVGRPSRVVDALVQVVMFGLGVAVLGFSVQDLSPSWDAAHGRGVPGHFTVTSAECGGRGGCMYLGTFRSTDGRYTFSDVELVGDSGKVGDSVPVLYEGDGETPYAVYARGWSAFVGTMFLAVVSLAMIGESIRRVLTWRRRPSGRHAVGGAQ
ncbi:hypothetical protein GCM10027599_03630 [Yimella radicis]